MLGGRTTREGRCRKWSVISSPGSLLVVFKLVGRPNFASGKRVADGRRLHYCLGFGHGTRLDSRLPTLSSAFLSLLFSDGRGLTCKEQRIAGRVFVHHSRVFFLDNFLMSGAALDVAVDAGQCPGSREQGVKGRAHTSGSSLTHHVRFFSAPPGTCGLIMCSVWVVALVSEGDSRRRGPTYLREHFSAWYPHHPPALPHFLTTLRPTTFVDSSVMAGPLYHRQRKWDQRNLLQFCLERLIACCL